jgi:inner membrane transporter RhtA
MARLARATRALEVSLLPTPATRHRGRGLAHAPAMLEVLGVALVIAGVPLHRWLGDDPQDRPRSGTSADAAVRSRRPHGRGWGVRPVSASAP